MEPDDEVYGRFLSVDWFSRCGVESDALPFPVRRVETAAEAMAFAESELWAEVKTEAQGDLTAYLDKNHYNDYGGWNRLGEVIRKRIQSEIAPRLAYALRRICADALFDIVVVDLIRIALHSAYARRFRRVPDFFERLSSVYECGHLPCGWSDELNAWPNGQFIVY